MTPLDNLVKAALSPGSGLEGRGGGLVDTAADREVVTWSAGVEYITAIQCHIVGVKRSTTFICPSVRLSSQTPINPSIQTYREEPPWNILYVRFVLSQKRHNINFNQLKSQAKNNKKKTKQQPKKNRHVQDRMWNR